MAIGMRAMVLPGTMVYTLLCGAAMVAAIVCAAFSSAEAKPPVSEGLSTGPHSRPVEARAHLEEALAANRKCVRANLQLGDILVAAGDHTGAIAAWKAWRWRTWCGAGCAGRARSPWPSISSNGAEPAASPALSLSR